VDIYRIIDPCCHFCILGHAAKTEIISPTNIRHFAILRLRTSSSALAVQTRPGRFCKPSRSS
jgi:hypothetical protein